MSIRTTFAAILVWAATGMQAQAAQCQVLATETISFERTHNCSKKIRVLCGGPSFEFDEGASHCCSLPSSKKVEWYCGDGEKSDFRCSADPDAAKVLLSLSGSKLSFQCLSEPSEPEVENKEEPEEVEPESSLDAGEAGTEPKTQSG